MQEVAPENERVDGGEDGVDPAGGDEDGLALLDDAAVTHVHLVPKEHLTLATRRHPVLIQRQVGWGRPDHVEDLLSLKRINT